jgi:predicted ATPase
MLRTIGLRSFKAYEDQDVDLAPLTVIIGPNGSGKTTLLQAVEFLGALVRGTLTVHLERHGWDYKSLTRLQAATRQFGFVATVDLSTTMQWTLTLGARRNPGIAAEEVLDDNDLILMQRVGRRMERFDEGSDAYEEITQTLMSSWLSAIDENDSERFPELVELAQWARGIHPYIALDPARLREPSRKSVEGIGPGGENLAGFLRALKDRDADGFDRVVRRLQRHYPRLVDLTVRQGAYGWNRVEITESWGGDEVSLNARQVSDGLLRLLAIAAMHETPDKPTVVMFDEIENGVHPHLLGGLVGMLRELADSGTQVIATTHSPVALNYVDPDSVLMATRNPKTGVARLNSLSSTAGFRALNAVFDPGELWYNVGERDLLRRPSPPKR